MIQYLAYKKLSLMIIVCSSVLTADRSFCDPLPAFCFCVFILEPQVRSIANHVRPDRQSKSPPTLPLTTPVA